MYTDDESNKIKHLFALRAIVCGLIVLAGAGITLIFVRIKVEPPQHDFKEFEKVLEGTTVKSGSIRLEMTGYGTVEPTDEIQISAEIRGRVTTTNKDLSVGLVVKKGDILATIDKSDYQLAVVEAEANLIQLQEEQELLAQIVRDVKNESTTEQDLLNLTESSWKRRAKLLAKKAVSQEEFEVALQNHSRQKLAIIKVKSALAQGEIKLKVNEAKINMAKAKLNQTKVDLRRSEVVAPISGRLTKVFVDDDEYVTAGTPICELANDRVFDISVSLDAKIASEVFNLKLRNKQYGVSFDTPENVDVTIVWPELPEDCRWKGRIKRIKKVRS